MAQSQTGDGDVKVAVNAFAGSRNADPTLKQAGYGVVVNTEIESEIEMGSHVDNAETPQNEKYDITCPPQELPPEKMYNFSIKLS